MTIHTASKHIHKLLLAIGLSTVLVSCGGGDSSPPPPDTTPNAFTITAITGAAVNTEVSSAAVNVTGVDQAVPISITGGTYSIAGGAFTNVAGTVSNNQSVVVKVTSSASTSTAVEAVLTIGGVAGSFKVTTLVDVTPNDFSFTSATGVVPKSVSTSAAITVASIDIAVPISITGGEYSIDDGAYTSAAGTVSKTQTVKVRGTASSNLSANTNVELTVGGVKGTYAITTFADTVAPTAKILFPPPVSMTESNTILVRGSASDDYGTVRSVKVMNGSTVITATTTDEFKNWQAVVPLTAAADNNLTVNTEDSAGNKSTTQAQPAAKVMVRQGDQKNAFPEADNGFEYLSDLAIDRLDGRSRVLVTNQLTGKVLSVDIATGKRSLFADTTEGGTVREYFGCNRLSIEPLSKHLYCVSESYIYNFNLANASYDATSLSLHDDPQGMVVDNSDTTLKLVTSHFDGLLKSSNVATSAVVVISDAAQNIPNNSNPLIQPFGIILDKTRDRYLVASGDQESDEGHAIVAVDRKTGARTVLSGDTTGSGVNFTKNAEVHGAGLFGLALDEPNNRVLVTEYIAGRIFAVDLTSGNRSLLSDRGLSNMPPDRSQITGIQILDSASYAFVIDLRINGIYAVDLVNGQRVIFSKSASDYLF